MRTLGVLLLVAMLQVGAQPAALAQDGLTIRLLNDTPDNLLVTLYDRSVRPPQRVLSGAVINGNSSISVALTPDASGRGNLSWNAVTVDQDMRRCGRRTRHGVNGGDTVRVFANRRCPSR